MSENNQNQNQKIDSFNNDQDSKEDETAIDASLVSGALIACTALSYEVPFKKIIAPLAIFSSVNTLLYITCIKYFNNKNIKNCMVYFYSAVIPFVAIFGIGTLFRSKN
jgi:hypothetical protein